jgi:hypothetical protein
MLHEENICEPLIARSTVRKIQNEVFLNGVLDCRYECLLCYDANTLSKKSPVGINIESRNIVSLFPFMSLFTVGKFVPGLKNGRVKADKAVVLNY